MSLINDQHFYLKDTWTMQVLYGLWLAIKEKNKKASSLSRQQYLVLLGRFLFGLLIKLGVKSIYGNWFVNFIMPLNALMHKICKTHKNIYPFAIWKEKILRWLGLLCVSGLLKTSSSPPLQILSLGLVQESMQQCTMGIWAANIDPYLVGR